ncbi:MAG: molybdopterin cofactor-binding domain-containing protein, partial [Bosea sp. (in: a-proteobacteria)]
MHEALKPRRKEAITGGVGTPLGHDSATKHVAGEAIYIDDIPEPAGLVHAYLGLSTRAHARIRSMDLSAVRAAPGVMAVLDAKDIPGQNDISPTHRHDEPVFASDKVLFHGQPLLAVVATTRDAARRAAVLAEVAYEDFPASLDIASARAAGGNLVTDPLTLARGDVAAAMAASPRRIKGSMSVGGQDHFYLEGQIALALPGEDEDVTVFSSTQHPSEVQHMV